MTRAELLVHVARLTIRNVPADVVVRVVAALPEYDIRGLMCPYGYALSIDGTEDNYAVRVVRKTKSGKWKPISVWMPCPMTEGVNQAP